MRCRLRSHVCPAQELQPQARVEAAVAGRWLGLVVCVGSRDHGLHGSSRWGWAVTEGVWVSVGSGKMWVLTGMAGAGKRGGQVGRRRMGALEAVSCWPYPPGASCWDICPLALPEAPAFTKTGLMTRIFLGAVGMSGRFPVRTGGCCKATPAQAHHSTDSVHHGFHHGQPSSKTVWAALHAVDILPSLGPRLEVIFS